MIYNKRAGIDNYRARLNVAKDHGMTQPHPLPLEYRNAVLDALNADLDNPDTPYIPLHAIILVREAFTAVGVAFDLRKGEMT